MCNQDNVWQLLYIVDALMGCCKEVERIGGEADF
jgi:hypothetical protein